MVLSLVHDDDLGHTLILNSFVLRSRGVLTFEPPELACGAGHVRATADGVRPAATKSAPYIALCDIHTTYDLTLTTQASMIHRP